MKIGRKVAEWTLASRFEPYGSALSIKLDHGVKKGKTFELDVLLILNISA